MDIQNFIDDLSNKWADERKQSQLTLGNLIELLEKLDPKDKVQKLDEPHSYRGYYTDLAFIRDEYNLAPVGEVLDILKSCVSKTYTGWKGGDYTMDENTPIWVVESEGRCGLKIVGLEPDGAYIFKDDIH
jgi:hypothetical protein